MSREPLGPLDAAVKLTAVWRDFGVVCQGILGLAGEEEDLGLTGEEGELGSSGEEGELGLSGEAGELVLSGEEVALGEAADL